MPRLENWTRMKGKSRVVPSPRQPEVGDIVGGDVFGSQNHDDGKTITTGDVIEVRPSAVVTKSNKNEGGTETYELGAWMWDDPAAKKSLGDPLIARVFEDDVVLCPGQSVTVRFKGKSGSVDVEFKADVAPEILVTVKTPSDTPVNLMREAMP